jgi:catechol 2,3-dioxygenase-like lactoylglutathione lyase family enzyme
MLGDARLIGLIATAKPEEARHFYRDTLGLKLLDESEHGMAFMSGAQMLRVQTVGSFTPHSFTAAGWAVSDIESCLAALSEAGVEAIHYDGLEQDDAGIWSPAPGARIAWFRDPDGNTLSLSEFPGE